MTNEEQTQQPAAGAGKCINCGAKAATLIDLCQPCCDRWSEERAARASALKENGRLRTERLAREAAADSAKAPLADRTAFDSSAWVGEGSRARAEAEADEEQAWRDYRRAADEMHEMWDNVAAREHLMSNAKKARDFWYDSMRKVRAVGRAHGAANSPTAKLIERPDGAPELEPACEADSMQRLARRSADKSGAPTAERSGRSGVGGDSNPSH